MIRLAGVAAALGLSACQLVTEPGECHDSLGGPAVQVEVTDSLTGEYLALEASGWIERGAYREEMYRVAGFIEERYLFADGSGPGSYEVFVEAPGYRPWSLTRLDWTRAATAAVDGCGALHGAFLRVRLVQE